MGALGHLDVGASGGLNLLLDQYEYHYAEKPTGHRRTDDRTRRRRAVGRRARRDDPRRRSRCRPGSPAIGPRLGIDRDPIDVTDPGWLRDGSRRASGRTRPTGSIASGRRSGWPPRRRRRPARRRRRVARRTGIADVGDDGHPVVTNSWVLNYLTPQRASRLPRRTRPDRRRARPVVGVRRVARTRARAADRRPASSRPT